MPVDGGGNGTVANDRGKRERNETRKMEWLGASEPFPSTLDYADQITAQTESWLIYGRHGKILD